MSNVTLMTRYLDVYFVVRILNRAYIYFPISI